MSLIIGNNSYVSVDEADTLLINHVKYSRWSELTDSEKTAYLIQACEDIEQLSNRFVGERYNETQDLSFPRTLILGDSDFENITPDNIKKAQAIQALWLVSNYDRREERYDMQDLGVTEVSVGNVSEKRNILKLGICIEALRKLKPYLKSQLTKTYYRT